MEIVIESNSSFFHELCRDGIFSALLLFFSLWVAMSTSALVGVGTSVFSNVVVLSRKLESLLSSALVSKLNYTSIIVNN